MKNDIAYYVTIGLGVIASIALFMLVFYLKGSCGIVEAFEYNINNIESGCAYQKNIVETIKAGLVS